MRFVAELGAPQPPVFHVTAEFIINQQLRRVLQAPELDLLQVAMLLEAAKRDQVALDQSGLGFEMRVALERIMRRLQSQPDNLGLLQKAVAAVDLARLLPFYVDLWKVQNLYYEIMQKIAAPERAAQAENAAHWQKLFRKLGDLLKVRWQEPPKTNGSATLASEADHDLAQQNPLLATPR
jgi:hypothetical protein